MPVLFLINDDDIYLDLRVRVVLIAPINIALIPVPYSTSKCYKCLVVVFLLGS